MLVPNGHSHASLVVRLKGGDPYVFGRGGEEASALAEAGVPFEVVPGVTSAPAALSYAGVPATDRRYAASFHVLTGHRKANGELGIDFDALVRAGGTDVFLMAVATLGEVRRELPDAGAKPDTPACVVERGALPGRRCIDATLVAAERAAREASYPSGPARGHAPSRRPWLIRGWPSTTWPPTRRPTAAPMPSLRTTRRGAVTPGGEPAELAVAALRRLTDRRASYHESTFRRRGGPAVRTARVLRGDVMKIKDGFVLRQVAGQGVVIATGEASKEFSGMVKLNGTGSFIWERVAEGLDEDAIAKALVAEYDVTPEKAASDVAAFAAKMRENGFLA